jgi:flagellin
MLSLHTNAASLSAQNSLSRTQGSLSTSMTRLSTGYRINSAMDDAAGLQIATRLKAQTSGMAVAMRNTQNSTSMLQTAGGALTEVTNMLVRMKDLATQAADQSSGTTDQAALNKEFQSLSKELKNVADNTSFGGQKLFRGTLASAMTFQIGASDTETMSIDVSTAENASFLADVDTNISALDLTSAANATSSITALTTAIDNVGALNSQLGAAANRLDHVYNNLSNISTNVQNATGRIMDVDFATESSSMTSNQMLMQAGTAMLKQTNSMSSMVMSLLQ